MLVGFKKKNSRGVKKVIIDNKLPCSNCGYFLDVSNFYKDSKTATGYRSDCKLCAKRHKREKIKRASTSGIIGIFLNKCVYKGCQISFTTKTTTKAFCSAKCRKRDWYEKNEQYKRKTV
ncbi:MAG TPA: hypothetical protein VJY14_00990 [Aliarcobacter sp.]|nr:hypothetical protein [Aliarcobacter sp.]